MTVVSLGRAVNSRGPRLSPTEMFAVAVISIIVLVCLFGTWITPTSPAAQHLLLARQPPTPGHVLGTDALGRDILTRIFYGARISLIVGITAVVIAGAIGISLGMIAGFYGGRIDDIIMRIADIQLAVPFILLAIAILAVLGQGLDKIIITLGVSGWVTYGRVVRGSVLSWREKEFVEAARAIGARNLSIMFKHILPNTVASIIVIASFAVANTILAEASLSFLGLGVPPDVPTWGGMVAAGRDYIITNQWWIYTFPGIAIMLTVLGINVVGDWLRDVLDPRMERGV